MMPSVLRTEALSTFLILLCVNLWPHASRYQHSHLKLQSGRSYWWGKYRRGSYVLLRKAFWSCSATLCQISYWPEFSHMKFWQRKFRFLCKKRGTDVGWQPAFPSVLCIKALKTWFFDLEFILKKYKVLGKAL